MSLTGLFGAADYAVLCIVLLVSVGSGIFYALSGDKQRTTSEYLVGNRGLSAFPVAISLMVSFESGILLTGGPAEVYVYGVQWFMAIIGYVIADVISSQTFVPFLHRMELTSVYEYLELRFQSHYIRLLGTLVGICREVLYMGIVLYAPALAIEIVTGFPLWASITVVGITSILYTSLGGIKAVVWTDVFQSILMFCGILAFIIKGTISVGGSWNVLSLAYENGRMNFFNFDPDPTTRHTFWSLLLGSVIGGFRKPFDQTSMQRIVSTKDVKDAKRMYLATAILFLVINVFVVTEGLILYAYYHQKRCDPIESGNVRDANQILPYTFLHIFSSTPGLPGLFLASVFSACLSSISSSLTSMSALFWKDLVQPHCQPMSQVKATCLTKLSVLGFGAIGIGIAFLASTFTGTLVQIAETIDAMCDSPLTGMFLIGCLFPWANATGAFAGCVSAIGLILWIVIGSYSSTNIRVTPPLPPVPSDQCQHAYLHANISHFNYTDSAITTIGLGHIEIYGLDYLYSLSYKLYATIGIATVMIVGSLFSLLTGGHKSWFTDRKYIIYLFEKFTWHPVKQISEEENYDMNNKI